MKLNNIKLNQIGTFIVIILIILSFLDLSLAYAYKHKFKRNMVPVHQVTNVNSTINDNTNKIKSNIKPIEIIHTYHKIHKKVNLKHNDIEQEYNHNDNNINNIYFHWGIFVPLVILLFIITVLSIIGFLFLLINSATKLPPLENPDYDHINKIKRANYLAKLRMKKESKKKKKAQQNGEYQENRFISRHNYVAEPENEGMVVRH